MYVYVCVYRYIANTCYEDIAFIEDSYVRMYIYKFTITTNVLCTYSSRVGFSFMTETQQLDTKK